jgi:predicted MPP superfamily phosphohydrolase
MPTTLTRRQMIKLSAGALLAAGLWPRVAHAADAPTKPLTFLQLNDFHYAEEACAPFFEGLVSKINQIQDAALLIIAGDLLDDGTADQANALHDILAKLKIPYHVTCGNHDYHTQTDRSAFTSVFGDKFNTFFEVEGWQFVALDTADGTKASNFDCKKDTLDFAASLPTKLDKAKPTFLFTHFPLAAGVTNRLRNADTLLEPFKQLNLLATFSGHYHAFTEKTILTNVTATTDVCCSRKRANHDNKFEKGFFRLDAADGKCKRTFVEYGTDFKGSATPNNRPLPTSRPAVTDPSRPSF